MTGPQQELVEQLFPAVVAESPFHYWRPVQPIVRQGKRWLVGVASYSGYDMRLLDLLEEALRSRSAEAGRVDVFNTQECLSLAEFQRYVPGIEEPYQTPVVGLWRDGILIDKGWGAEARDRLLVRPFGLDWASEERRWDQNYQALGEQLRHAYGWPPT